MRQLYYSDEHAGYGITTHENGKFLYKSYQTNDFLYTQRFNYMAAISCLGFFLGWGDIWLMGTAYFVLQWPRNFSMIKYFTFHAELLPQTEQVVFHKVNVFGAVERIYVDIKNLEKIEAD